MLSQEDPLTDTISVLIADDHELTRFSLKLAMQQHGKTELVGIARNGREAVDLVNQYKPDVVVLDLQMPIMDGLSASKYIKSAHPQTKIIAYSSVKDPQMETMLQEAKFDAFCEKETGTQELLSLVMQLGIDGKQ